MSFACLFSIAFITILPLSRGQFNRPAGLFQQQPPFTTNAQLGGNTFFQNVNPSTPTGYRGCFCLPANQLCDPSGQIPRTATRISNVNTRIINLNANKCPEDQRECCFGSFVGDGNVVISPIPSPLTGCGARKVVSERGTSPNADLGEYPWMAAIIGAREKFIAGGVLIDPYWVLTAAHKILEEGVSLQVRLGDHDLSDPRETPHQTIRVQQVVLHPRFNSGNLINDVALLRLREPARIGPYANIACLPENSQKFTGQRCFASGWGKDLAGRFQPVLKEVDLPIIDEFLCEHQLRQTRLGSSFRFDKDSFLCAGGEAGKDACEGDGGAPLVCDEGGVFTVVGLVAWGIGCGQDQVPGVYVNVASFSDYISNIVYGRN